MRRYTVLNPSTKDELRDMIERAVRDDHILSGITAVECLDEFTARRRKPKTISFELHLHSIHFGEDGHVICEVVDSNLVARIDFESDAITLTTVSSGEDPLAFAP